MKKNVITIATGKKLYVDLAINLARSFWYWNNNTDINFYIVTDREEYLTSDVRQFSKTINIAENELGKGFTPKLFLDQLAPSGQTLFIDSDCLVYGDLTPVFEKFKDHNVSVIGNFISKGEWFGNIEQICDQFNIPHLPKFNGGVYYLENGEIASRVYQKARELESSYDQIRFVRLRGRPNDEVLMAVAMQLFGQEPVKEDGTIMAEFVNFQSGVKSDLLKGKIALYNVVNHKKYVPEWPLHIAEPLIVHYLGHHNKLYPYTKEIKILDLVAKNYSIPTAKFISWLSVSTPYLLKSSLKDFFRPIYRALFGFRKSSKSERIIE